MDIKKKILIHKLNKIGTYDSNKNICYVNIEKATNKDGNIDLSYLEELVFSTDSPTFVIEGENIFEKDDQLPPLYMNIPGNIIFRNCNFDRVHPQIESIGSVSFIDCKFVMSQVDVRSVKSEITNCVSSNTNFDIDSESACFDGCNFNGENSNINVDYYIFDYDYPDYGEIVVRNCNFDVDELDIKSTSVIHICDNTNITANKLKISSINGCISNSDIVAMRFYSENNEQLLINNGVICAEHSKISGDELDIRNSSLNIENFEIDNNTTILYKTNLVGKEVVINSHSAFNIDEVSEVRCDRAFFEIPNGKLYPNSVKAASVLLNGSLVTNGKDEYADITLIEPRNKFITFLKKINANYNYDLDLVTKQLDKEIRSTLTAEDMKKYGNKDKGKILKKVKININK